jgi:membrane fusion protein (multidrug efflux system)
MRIGQPVKLTADAYGSHVEYHGTIAGVGVGTGAAFALLPAQNATGNWIKVVQRIPVRIALDPKELADHPLRVGLSMEVEVDVKDDNGKTLATAPRVAAAYSTAVFDHAAEEADGLVQKTIVANLGVTKGSRVATIPGPRSATPVVTSPSNTPAAMSPKATSPSNTPAAISAKVTTGAPL